MKLQKCLENCGKDEIINSFKKTGISITLDGSKNNLIITPENIMENFE